MGYTHQFDMEVVFVIRSTRMSRRMLTLGEVADRLGCQLWHVQRVFDHGLMPDRRLGRTRYVYEDELPAVRQALHNEGRITRGPAISD